MAISTGQIVLKPLDTLLCKNLSVLNNTKVDITVQVVVREKVALFVRTGHMRDERQLELRREWNFECVPIMKHARAVTDQSLFSVVDCSPKNTKRSKIDSLELP